MTRTGFFADVIHGGGELGRFSLFASAKNVHMLSRVEQLLFINLRDEVEFNSRKE